MVHGQSPSPHCHLSIYSVLFKCQQMDKAATICFSFGEHKNALEIQVKKLRSLHTHLSFQRSTLILITFNAMSLKNNHKLLTSTKMPLKLDAMETEPIFIMKSDNWNRGPLDSILNPFLCEQKLFLECVSFVMRTSNKISATSVVPVSRTE